MIDQAMAQIKTGRRSALTIGITAAVVATGVIALNQTKIAKEPKHICKGDTAEVEFQVSARQELPMDIEWFATGSHPGSARVRTRSWLTVEPAVACPGVASLNVFNRRESGQVTCTIWADNKIIASRESRGNEECSVKITLIKQ